MSRFSVVGGKMGKTTVTKKQTLLNDKRFYFPNGIVSLPFRHPIVAEIDNFKQ